MVHERREPTLSSSTVDVNDKRTARPTPRTSQPARQVVVQKQSSGFLWLTFLLLMITAAAVAYTFWLQYNNQQIIAQQQERIAELENKLALSDDESTQSLTALAANVKSLSKDVTLALSEVDKLWGTRNVNKTAIEATDKKLTESVSQLTSSLAALQDKTIKPLASVQQRTSEQELLIQSLRERQAEQEKTIKNVVADAKQFAPLAKDVSSLSKKVQSYDEAIESMDKFRLTTNRDLLLLKQRAGLSQ